MPFERDGQKQETDKRQAEQMKVAYEKRMIDRAYILLRQHGNYANEKDCAESLTNAVNAIGLLLLVLVERGEGTGK